jgi:hypothetical protein
MISDHAGQAKVAEGGVYVLVAVRASNLTHQKQVIGGMFGKNFKLRQDDIVYDVDSGVGFTFGNDEKWYSGALDLPPLFKKTFLVVFTVPQELANGIWFRILPDGHERLLGPHQKN